MAFYKVRNTGLSNEMLTLWLEAKDGLSCEEARELIERLHREEVEHAYDIAEQEEEHVRAMEDAEERGYDNGRRELARDVQRALDDASNDEAACYAIQKLVA